LQDVEPTFGEVLLETNATLFREVIENVWDKSRFEPQAAEGLQPVICFADRVSKLVKQVGKTFYMPVINIVGWIERDKVPGWREREPTVLPPKALPVLPAPSAPALSTPAVKKPAKTKRAAAKPGPGDPPADLNDDIPWK
jgi:hypothetical protein